MLDETLLMAFAKPESLVFWVEEKVRYQDLDPNNHINNIAYLAYVEACRLEYRAALIGDDPEDTMGRWVIAATGIRFLQPGHYPGRVKVGAAPLQIGRTSFSLGYGIFQADSCLAVAGSRSVYVDAGTGKPTPLPQDFEARLTGQRQP